MASLSRVGRCRAGLTGFVVHGDLKRFQETVILGRELDLAGTLEATLPFRLGRRLVRGGILAVVALIEPNGGFQHQEDVVPGALDFTNGFRDPLDSESESLIAFPNSCIRFLNGSSTTTSPLSWDATPLRLVAI